MIFFGINMDYAIIVFNKYYNSKYVQLSALVYFLYRGVNYEYKL